tara:strand:+ start:583 stop:786 length:204 start_codon:yes stop_codon:yes gene_type:complete
MTEEKGGKMSKKIKIELTEKQYFAVTMTLSSHCFDIEEDTTAKTEYRVIANAVEAMDKGYQEWKEGK